MNIHQCYRIVISYHVGDKTLTSRRDNLTATLDAQFALNSPAKPSIYAVALSLAYKLNNVNI